MRDRDAGGGDTGVARSPLGGLPGQLPSVACCFLPGVLAEAE